jgi:cytochrome P450
MTDEQARDEATILFLAGRETIGDVLAWTWYELVRNPEVAALLRAEVDDVLAGQPPTREALACMPLLNQVVLEGLRLYPVGWAVLRQTVAPDRLGGYSLPTGSYVLVSPYVMQRDARFFPDPARFDPGRWPEGPAPEPAAFIPFSLGPRSCVGEHLARLALPLLLATVVQRWTAELVGAPPKAVPTFAIRPQGGMTMRLSRRG